MLFLGGRDLNFMLYVHVQLFQKFFRLNWYGFRYAVSNVSFPFLFQEEFLKDVMEFLLLRGHSRLIPQGGLEEFPDAILNGKRLDLFNLYKEVRSWIIDSSFGILPEKIHIERAALLHRWSLEEAFMSVMVSTGKGRSSLRCITTQCPTEWLYVQQAFCHRFVTLMLFSSQPKLQKSVGRWKLFRFY